MDYKLKKMILFPMNLLYKANPVLEIKMMFFLKQGYKLDLRNPITYSEKIQWIKFYGINMLMITCADKYTVRDYVKDCGFEELLTPILWAGFDPSQIPFNTLPDQFVIKATHGSGFNIICKDKSVLNINKVKKQLSAWLKEKYIPCYGEWFYGVVKPRIIIEKYLDSGDGRSPNDYKVICFHGEPKIIQLHINRFTDHKMILYDPQWKEISNYRTKYSFDKQYFVEKPEELHQLLEYAKKLANPFPMARVDFYIVKGKIYFSEITFTDGAGFDKIEPYSFDAELGSYLKIP